jgi:hypothetical protein
MCVQCGCINDPGTAVAWAEAGARSREKVLEDRMRDLELRLNSMELRMQILMTGNRN